ncbi:MAG: DUF429 domain-containing protein [Armatimonadota bacterium]|nr:DUF429 domain-containing protein [Armatimonadota bacterium]
MATLVVGVDGCRGGWVCAVLSVSDAEAALEQLCVWARFEQVLRAYPTAAAIAVDMPIGLWESGRACMRPCDQVARARLGKRACTVFIPPTRAMLNATAYAPLRALGLSVQAYNLISRIREIDSIITPALQAQVWESHPELCFAAMVGAPIPYPKRTAQGHSVRLHALRNALGEGVYAGLTERLAALPQDYGHRQVRADDVVDACALAWSAWRHWRGQSEVCVGEPSRDARGLLMAIRY